MKRLAAAVFALAAGYAAAQAYPSKPVTVIVPWPAGGPSDIAARPVAKGLGDTFKQVFVIDNRGGASGNIGSALVAKAAPDGYTLLMTSSSPIVINPNVYKSMPFDAQKDLAPITNLLRVPLVLAVHPSIPAKNLKELLAWIAANKSKAQYASAGNGTPQHMTGELFKTAANLKDLTHVPYKGSAPAITDALGGHVPIIFDSTIAILPQLKDKKLIPIAVTSAKRHSGLPDVPTFSEAGLKGVESYAWYGFFAPAKTPKDVIARLNAEAQKVMKGPDFKKVLDETGSDYVGDSPENFAKFIQAEHAKWGKVAKDSGATLGLKNKIVSAADALAIVRDGDTIAFSGFVGTGTPDELIGELERRFVETGHPRDLTLVFAAAPGDGKERGLNKLAHKGLVKRVVGGHWSLVPKLGAMAVANEIEAYNLPLGVISHLFRDIGAHRAGAITKVGLRTFVDPRLGGGRLNSKTRDALVRVMQIEGEEWLFYKAFPITVAFIRGTTADTNGNITMEHEALILDNLAIATAAKNSGGFVIAQVERVCAAGAQRSREVIVPGVMVDCAVVARPENHHQTYGTVYSAGFAGEHRVALDSLAPMPMDERKIIARRAAFELPMGGVVNLGIGMPEGVAAVANEEKVLSHVTLTAEPGVIGGVPQSGLDFGAALNTEALLHQNQQFDFYDGGGLDMACLGMAEVDGEGNINVSRFGPKLAGAGGFINISQSARKLVFTGTFTAGGLRVEIDGTELVIVKEGRSRKFVKAVEQITFSGAYAAEKGQSVLYVTERCVFRRTVDGMELIEVAPGIDIERDILAQMDFVPIVKNPVPMDPRIFADEPMHLEDTLLGLGMAQRVSYDVDRNILFTNLEGMHVRTRDDVDRIRRAIEDRVQVIGRKVALVANYDQFVIDSGVTETYSAMLRYLETHYYTTATRYTTSAFLRVKLGEALSRRQMKPHIFETRDEAQAYLAAEDAAGDGGGAA